MSVIHVESRTWFDNLPTEIILTIFDYLSNNDIIYTFFFFNQRLNYLLLQNQRYFNYLDLPTTNLDLWTNILPIIGSHIKCLNINTIDLSFSLIYFQNLKSIILSSPFGFPDEQLKLILDNNQFNHLHSFKIKESRTLSKSLSNNYLSNQDYLLEKIFNNNNSLKIFQYSLKTASLNEININSVKTNHNLHSLTIILRNFRDIFTLINVLPKLTYLNVRSKPPYNSPLPILTTDIKLKQLYFKLKHIVVTRLYNIPQLFNCIKQISSSLTCLSLNLIGMCIRKIDDLPINSIKLQRFLESMIELKQFHLYARLHSSLVDKDIILSRFENKFWYDRNLSFGMHRNYFYTLPFHFDYLYGFNKDFNSIQSNNPEILINNPRIWYYVKSIDLYEPLIYDSNFLKELQIKMPNLTFIKFNLTSLDGMDKTDDLNETKIERKNIHITLNKVTTIECVGGSLEPVNEWLINLLPNLKHLILSATKLPSIDNQLTEILDKRIQQLDIYTYLVLEQINEMNYVYFSNVQYVCFSSSRFLKPVNWYASVTLKILNNFKSLKILMIFYPYSSRDDLSKLIENLDMNEIMINYHVKQFKNYCLFLKKISLYNLS